MAEVVSNAEELIDSVMIECEITTDETPDDAAGPGLP